MARDKNTLREEKKRQVKKKTVSDIIRSCIALCPLLVATGFFIS
jgi:hypothetical protein